MTKIFYFDNYHFHDEKLHVVTYRFKIKNETFLESMCMYMDVLPSIYADVIRHMLRLYHHKNNN